jgi:hypothetical protein
VPSKIHDIQLVKIQPAERLAATAEQHSARRVVTLGCEARGTGYWAATQVKGLSPEIPKVSKADVFPATEGSIFVAVSPQLTSSNGEVSPARTRQGDKYSTGSETVARYQMDGMGTREAQCVLPRGVCILKPMNGKSVQMTHRESDQFIVPMKQGNACGGKGLAGMRCNDGDTPSPHGGGS